MGLVVFQFKNVHFSRESNHNVLNSQAQINLAQEVPLLELVVGPSNVPVLLLPTLQMLNVPNTNLVVSLMEWDALIQLLVNR